MIKLGTAFAAFGLSLALAQAPAQAASQMTEAFLGNVAANLAILNTSSRLAAGHTESSDLEAYAADTSAEATHVASALTEATPSDVRFAQASPADLMTGRSVAVAGMTGHVSNPMQQGLALEAANARMPATADLTKLQTLRGAAFDNLFFTLQLDALSQIESDYRTYIKHGDDPAIASMAHKQLPALMKRLEALTRV